MRYKPCNPDLIRERIIRIKAELRRLQMELRLAEAERRDRKRLQQMADPFKEDQP